MAVASNPMNDANAKAKVMPAEPVSPPATIAEGLKEASTFTPSGPPLDRMAADVITRHISSSSIRAPRIRAPTSTWQSDSSVTSAQAIEVHAHQGSTFFFYDTTPTKKPKRDS